MYQCYSRKKTLTLSIHSFLYLREEHTKGFGAKTQNSTEKQKIHKYIFKKSQTKHNDKKKFFCSP